jgi:hypothetical protein
VTFIRHKHFFIFRLFTETCKRPYVLQAVENGYGDTILSDTGFKSACNFNPSLPLKIVVHGFIQNGRVKWVNDMAAALLNKVITFITSEVAVKRLIQWQT